MNCGFPLQHIHLQDPMPHLPPQPSGADARTWCDARGGAAAFPGATLGTKASTTATFGPPPSHYASTTAMITADAFGAPLASTPARIICRPRPTPPVLATSAPSRPMRLHCRHPRLPPPRPTCVLHHPRHHRPSRRQRSGWSGCSQMAYRIRAATDSPSRHRHHSRTTASRAPTLRLGRPRRML